MVVSEVVVSEDDDDDDDSNSDCVFVALLETAVVSTRPDKKGREGEAAT